MIVTTYNTIWSKLQLTTDTFCGLTILIHHDSDHHDQPMILGAVHVTLGCMIRLSVVSLL